MPRKAVLYENDFLFYSYKKICLRGNIFQWTVYRRGLCFSVKNGVKLNFSKTATLGTEESSRFREV